MQQIKMPTAVNEKCERSEQMCNALKRHILLERERKKQEREAEVEEERLRKEREAREQQDVMTLGETKEQITQLEVRLAHLKEEKHQLFLQLKKVLNEDDNRRKQLTKEASEVVPLQALPTIVHQQLYMPPGITRGMPVAQPAGFKPTTKRARSPSPPPASIPVYHQNAYAYKPTSMASGATYSPSPAKEDARRHEYRAVLWNKTQYPNQGAYYTVPPAELSMYYPPQASGLPPREPPRQVFDAGRGNPAYHIESKPIEHYALNSRQPTSHIMHAASMPINAPPPPPAPKTAAGGSITAGYPVRQKQYQQPPPPTQQPPPPPAALYSTQNRPLYQSAISYPARE